MKLRLYLLDRNIQWEVVRTETAMMDTLNLEELDYKLMDIDSFAVYEYINENLRDGKIVYIPKYLEGELTVDKVIIAEDENPLILYKRTCVIKLKDYVYNLRLTPEYILDMYRFIVINNWMIANGYFITNENREEKYMEIITSISEIEDEEESEAKINKLEQYLNLMDKLASDNNIIISMDEAVDNIIKAETSDEVTYIFNSYMAQFN